MSAAAATPGASPATSSPRGRAWPFVAAALAVVALVAGLLYLFGGQRAEKLTDVYGQRRGRNVADSVNGTSVLAEMFKQAGHRVTTVDTLSPRLNKYETLVWFPDDFEPPTAEQREFLENWLWERSGRTVVYVGRDYDGATAYWKKVQPLAPAEVADEVQRALAQSKAAYDSQRMKMPKQQYARWFTARRDGKRRNVRTLQGPWASGINAKQVEIELEGRLDVPIETDRTTSDEELPEEFETLLESEGDPLVTRITDSAWDDGQVIVVTNGSFVLNYPLVNHEHRKLAGRLIDACTVGDTAFIESGPGGPEVSDKEADDSMQSGLALFKIWPLNAIVLHLTLLGIVLCIARSAIFGRPAELPTETVSDFGKHVTALGQLLARTKDRNYALARLQQYREQAQRGSGKSHRK